MPSSSASHSLSSVQTIDPKPASAQDTTADSSDRDDDGGGGGNARSWPATERVASYLRSQKSVHALCEKFGVNTKAFTPIPAGDRRACSPPPAGSICLYADALEAGMRVPLDPFFCEVLSHFGVAPSQLSPNCWRILAAFLALSRAAGVQLPSVPVFLHFFALRVLKVKGLYCFSPKDAAGVVFTGLPDKIKRWNERFFFLKSSAQWPCPVLWGEPTKKSTADPVLTNEEKSAVAKLLSVRGAAPIDVLIYLSEGDLAAARMTPRAPKPPTPSPSDRATGAKGMDPSTYAMMQNMRAEKAAAEAAAAAKVAVKSEPGCSAPPDWTPFSGKKRPAEDDRKEATSHGSASVPPGLCTRQRRKLQHAPDRHDGDTVGWEAARQLLQGVITPARERAFLVADPFTVIATSYVATLQAADYATFSLGHALKLQEELEKAKAAAVEEALKGYERGMEDMKRVALRLRPDIDAAQLFVPPGGFQ
ncbi:unnamed protein product [Miscanthus lutarioriparius]|uniref:Transposase (putative) gypsy type domain-containing protein n=1 Tax=Miscanthus lutarioriparius TaxID=422564 RepID=A0A811SAB6_9POAL|nr:unnamed protein product [Miscanthus lutarioriparius]